MDGITFGYLSPNAWLYLRRGCGETRWRLDAAQALAHAATCASCVYWLAEIAAGRRVERVRASAAGSETVVLTKLMTAVAS
jgi:hypothetical protein